MRNQNDLAPGGRLNEAGARDAVAAYSRMLWDRRLVTGTSGNVSVRLDDGDLLVTPASRSLRALDPYELVRTNNDGVPRGEAIPTSELQLHVAAYRVRSDVDALIHTHPTFCVVWSKAGRVFERDTVGASETLGPVAWTEFRPAGSAELAILTADAFAAGFDTVLMERHGLSAAGRTLEEALMRSDLAEEAARIAYFSALAFPQDAPSKQGKT